MVEDVGGAVVQDTQISTGDTESWAGRDVPTKGALSPSVGFVGQFEEGD